MREHANALAAFPPCFRRKTPSTGLILHPDGHAQSQGLSRALETFLHDETAVQKRGEDLGALSSRSKLTGKETVELVVLNGF